jgi:zinc protease
MEGIEAGYFGAYIGCSPDKIDKALEMMRIEFKKLCEKKVGQDELERAKRYLIGRHDIDLQRVSAIASSILYDDIYGTPYDESFHFGEKYRSINADDIMRVSQMIFEAAPVVSVVGPKDLKTSA